MLAACTLPGEVPLPLPVGTTPTAVVLPDHCQGDGAVQSWQMLPLDPLKSELLDAYGQNTVVEFQARVIGAGTDPAELPFRTYTLAEAAEGITLTLKYRGDPPPLMIGRDYRLVAWADHREGASGKPSQSEEMTGAAADARGDADTGLLGYGLQAYDEYGLLFLGLTDADLANDPLDILLENAEGDCPAVPAGESACVVERQVSPLRVSWDEEAVTLYPGETGQLVHEGRLYEVSLFRNRRVVPVDPPCPGWSEYGRSLRLERLHPPPLMPIIPSETITATAPITGRFPITVPSP